MERGEMTPARQTELCGSAIKKRRPDEKKEMVADARPKEELRMRRKKKCPMYYRPLVGSSRIRCSFCKPNSKRAMAAAAGSKMKKKRKKEEAVSHKPSEVRAMAADAEWNEKGRTMRADAEWHEKSSKSMARGVETGTRMETGRFSATYLEFIKCTLPPPPVKDLSILNPFLRMIKEIDAAQYKARIEFVDYVFSRYDDTKGYAEFQMEITADGEEKIPAQFRVDVTGDQQGRAEWLSDCKKPGWSPW